MLKIRYRPLSRRNVDRTMNENNAGIIIVKHEVIPLIIELIAALA